MESLAVPREGFRYLPLDRWAWIPIDQTERLVVISLSYLGVLFQHSDFSSEHVSQGDVLVFQGSIRKVQ
jgi:hypothetical protein